MTDSKKKKNYIIFSVQLKVLPYQRDKYDISTHYIVIQFKNNL